MTDEREYARLVALGLLRSAKRALIDARDLLYSVEHPRADDLATATLITAETEKELMEERQ